jgi:excisionase family DNA binding protein
VLIPEPDRITVTVAEAARLLGISRNSAFRAVQRRDLPSIRIGRRILIPRDRLVAMLGQHVQRRVARRVPRPSVEPDEPQRLAARCDLISRPSASTSQRPARDLRDRA